MISFLKKNKKIFFGVILGIMVFTVPFFTLPNISNAAFCGDSGALTCVLTLFPRTGAAIADWWQSDYIPDGKDFSGSAKVLCDKLGASSEMQTLCSDLNDIERINQNSTEYYEKYSELVNKALEVNPNLDFPINQELLTKVVSPTAEKAIKFSTGELALQKYSGEVGEWGCFPFLGKFCISRPVNAILVIVLNIFGLVLSLANLVFNASIEYSILEFKTYYDAVYPAWVIVRNFTNIIFVFALLYIAISTIIKSDIGNGKRVLVGIVVSALLVNFSFFFTGVIVDASNVITNGIYRGLPQAPNSSSERPDITTPLLSSMGIGPLLTSDLDYNKQISGTVSLPELKKPVSNRVNDLVQFFIAIIIILTAAGVLFAMSALLLIRAVIILFLAVLSPLAFLGSVIPKLSGPAQEWWSQLMNQALFAPAFMLTFYVSLFAARGLKINSLNEPLTVVIVKDFILLGLMIGSVIVAKRMGAIGGDWAVNVAKKPTGWAQGAARWTGGIAQRETVGRFGRFLAENDWIKNLPASKFPGGVALGTFLKMRGEEIGSKDFGGAKSYNQKIADYARIGNRLSPDPEKQHAFLSKLPPHIQGIVFEEMAPRSQAVRRDHFEKKMQENAKLKDMDAKTPEQKIIKEKAQKEYQEAFDAIYGQIKMKDGRPVIDQRTGRAVGLEKGDEGYDPNKRGILWHEDQQLNTEAREDMLKSRVSARRQDKERREEQASRVAINKVETIIHSRDSKTGLTDTEKAEVKKEMGNINASHIEFLNDEIKVDPDVSIYITPNQLRILAKSLGDNARAQIKGNVYGPYEEEFNKRLDVEIAKVTKPGETVDDKIRKSFAKDLKTQIDNAIRNTSPELNELADLHEWFEINNNAKTEYTLIDKSVYEEHKKQKTGQEEKPKP